MAEYQRRTVDDLLDAVLPELAAVALDGPKGVGKTATALRRARQAFLLDDPNTRALIAADPSRLESQQGGVLVDEWQRLPRVWDLVRRSVDRDPAGGRFLLTGSAAPLEAPVHSGAGRIVGVRMRPMGLHERGLETPTVSLGSLLSGKRPRVTGHTALTLPDYVEEIVASGLPGVRSLRERARRLQLDAYVDRIVTRDFAEQGMRVRRPNLLRAWLRAYAAATSTTASYRAIARAATAGDDGPPATETATAYRSVLEQLWVLDPLPGWTPSRSPLARLAQAPKHQLADPALAARLLDLTGEDLLAGERGAAPPLRSGPLVGLLFESLVVLGVRVLAEAVDARAHHLRTRNGDHEVDIIIERGRHVVAVEVKLGGSVTDKDVRNLHWLRQRLGDDLADAVMITTGSDAYRRADGIAVVPAALLGP